jgi:hypothetical protein
MPCLHHLTSALLDGAGGLLRGIGDCFTTPLLSRLRVGIICHYLLQSLLMTRVLDVEMTPRTWTGAWPSHFWRCQTDFDELRVLARSGSSATFIGNASRGSPERRRCSDLSPSYSQYMKLPG